MLHCPQIHSGDLLPEAINELLRRKSKFIIIIQDRERICMVAHKSHNNFFKHHNFTVSY